LSLSPILSFKPLFDPNWNEISKMRKKKIEYHSMETGYHFYNISLNNISVSIRVMEVVSQANKQLVRTKLGEEKKKN
jgi:hypothetical protein